MCGDPCVFCNIGTVERLINLNPIESDCCVLCFDNRKSLGRMALLKTNKINKHACAQHIFSDFCGRGLLEASGIHFCNTCSPKDLLNDDKGEYT